MCPLLIDVLRRTLSLYRLRGDPVFKTRSMSQVASWLESRIYLGRGRHHHDVVTAWFQAGIPFFSNMFNYRRELSLRNDKAVFLLIAEHCIPNLKKESFLMSSKKIRSDKAFMTKVLAKDASLFVCASTKLQHDLDFAVLAFASSPVIMEEYMEKHNTVDFAFLTRVSKHANSRLATHDGCIQTLLWNRNCSQHFDLSLRKLIIEYVGAPKSQERTLLRQANGNIELCLRGVATAFFRARAQRKLK